MADATMLNSIADAVDTFLTMKNNIAEKRQKQEMNELQMQQMRMQLQTTQRALQEQQALQTDIKNLPSTKSVPKAPEELPEEIKDLSPEELRSVYTPEKLAELTTKEVPLSDTEYMKNVVKIQLMHQAKSDPSAAVNLLKVMNAIEMGKAAKKAPSEVEVFEIDTGTDPKTRGTLEYNKKKMQYLRDKSAAQYSERYPFYQQGPTPENVFNRKTGGYERPTTPTGETPEDITSKKVDLAQKTSEARQRGGAMAAQINAANDLYQENLPKIIELRNKVAAKGLLPDTASKRLNWAKQFLQMEFSDPDMVELQGKIKLMADNLQKTIGGGQGGEWAFKVADTLLNTAFQGEAFSRRMQSHGADLKSIAESRRTFGKKPVSNSMITTEAQARQALSEKGILGEEANRYIKMYRGRGVIQ